MKKEPKINLAKCKIGQLVKTREGPTFTFDGPSGDRNFPFKVKERDWLYRPDGFFFENGPASFRDIVAVLPLPKKAGKPNTLDRFTSAFAKIAFKGDNDLIRKAAEQLEGLLKP